jgi:cardiolipin synthase A/B
MSEREVNRPLHEGGRPSRALGAIFAVAAGLVLASGCATSGKHETGAIVSKADKKSLTGMSAYVAGTNIEIVFPARREDTFAHASWSPPVETAGDYQDRLAVLTFEKQEPAVRRPVVRRGNKAVLRDAKQWQQLVQKVFQSLTPAQTNHGVLLLAQDHETVIFRDKDDKAKIIRLINKPPEITVDRTLDGKDFSREVIQLLEQESGTAERLPRQILFITGEDPAFVLVDVPQKLTVFFSYPPDPETRPMEVPGWFALRALNTLLFKSFIVTAIKNPVTLVGRGLWHIGNSGAAAIQSGSQSPAEAPPLYTGPGMDLAEWEKYLDESVSAKRYKGQIQFYIDGEKFFPAFIQSVQEAKKSVDVLVFIFDVDDYAVKMAALLKARSSQVRVRVLMDEMGSLFAAQVAPQGGPPDFQPPSDIRYYLKSGSHVQVRAAANPWLTADHRKCIIIDGRQAYVGGMNIGRDYRYEWHDMMVGLTGPVVGRLEKDYREAWAHAGLLGDLGYVLEWMFTPVGAHKLVMTNSIDIRPLRTATWNVGIYHAQLEAIRRAKRYIYIENAYFDDDTILRELIRARRRGVDVRVILPSENDSGIMQTGNQVMANDLVNNGIRVFAYPRMTHVKAAIYDGWACLGSANFEKMSLRIAQELDVGFSDPASVDQLKQNLFEKDFKVSREITKPVPLNWTDFVIKAFADQF